MESRVWRGCAGIMALILLLNGCGSAGGTGQGGTAAATAGTNAASTTETPAGTAVETPAESLAGTSEAPKDEDSAGTTAEASAEPSAGTTEPETGTVAASGEQASTEGPASSGEQAPSEGQASSGEQASTEVAAAVSLEDVYARIEQEVSLNSPMTVPEEYIANYFGIDVSAAEEYLFVMSEAATSAETIVIVKTGSENQQAVADALQQVIDQKAAEMEDYLPDQYDIVNKSSVRQAGDYVWLVISENAEAIQAIIEDELQ